MKSSPVQAKVAAFSVGIRVGLSWCFRCFMEPLVHVHDTKEHLLCSSCQGPPRWLAGTFFLLQMRRGVTLYDGEKRKPPESRLSWYSELSLLLKLRCLLHDVPPQTFIRPPKMVTFHTIVVLCWLGGENFNPFAYNTFTLLPHELHLREVAHSGVHGFISRLSWDKENRVPDKCSWRAVDRYGACRHRSSLCWKVSYPFILPAFVFNGFGFFFPYVNLFWDTWPVIWAFQTVCQIFSYQS